MKFCGVQNLPSKLLQIERGERNELFRATNVVARD